MRGVLVASWIVVAACGGAKGTAPPAPPQQQQQQQQETGLCAQCSCESTVDAGWQAGKEEVMAALAMTGDWPGDTCQEQFETSTPGKELRATAEACAARGESTGIVCGVGADEGGVCCKVHTSSVEVEGRRFIMVGYPGISDGQRADVYEVRGGKVEALCPGMLQWMHYLCTGTNSGGFRACPALDAAWPALPAPARNWVCWGSTRESEAATTTVVARESIRFEGEKVSYVPIKGPSLAPLAKSAVPRELAEGIAHEAAGRGAEAVAAYERAIPRAKDETVGSELRLRLGRLLLLQGAPWKAEAPLEKVAAAPHQAAALHALAWAYFAPGRCSEAMRTVARLRAVPGVAAAVIADVTRLEALCLADPYQPRDSLLEEDPAAKDLPAADRKAAAAYFAGEPATTRERVLWLVGKCAGLRSGFARGAATALSFEIETRPEGMVRFAGGDGDLFLERVGACVAAAVGDGPVFDAFIGGSVELPAPTTRSGR